MGLKWGLGAAETCRGPDEEVCWGWGWTVFFHLFCIKAQIWGWRSWGLVCHLCVRFPKCELISHLPIGGKNRCLRKTAEALLLGHLGRGSKENEVNPETNLHSIAGIRRVREYICKLKFAFIQAENVAFLPRR